MIILLTGMNNGVSVACSLRSFLAFFIAPPKGVFGIIFIPAIPPLSAQLGPRTPHIGQRTYGIHQGGKNKYQYGSLRALGAPGNFLQTGQMEAICLERRSGATLRFRLNLLQIFCIIFSYMDNPKISFFFPSRLGGFSL